MNGLRRRLSYANVTATVALLIAVAGGTTAIAGGSKAPKNSVVTRSIKPGNVTAKDLTTIVNRSATGVVTDPGPGDGNYTAGSLEVACPAGFRAISGGGTTSGSKSALQLSTRVGEGWRVVVGTDNNSAPIAVTVSCLIDRAGKPVTGS